MSQVSHATTQPLRIGYGAPPWAWAALLGAGVVLLASGLLAPGPSTWAGAASLAGLASLAVVQAASRRAGRREIRVDGEAVEVPGLVWGSARFPLETSMRVSLEPAEGPRKLRLVTEGNTLTVWGPLLDGGEDSLRALAVAVMRGSKSRRRASIPSGLPRLADATPRP